eukprot:g3849.t1
MSRRGRSLSSRLSSFDEAFLKGIDGVTQQTTTGAIITLCSVLFILTLTITEFFAWRQIYTTETLTVDTQMNYANVDIHFDLTFLKQNCDSIHVDVEDEKGLRKPGLYDTDIFQATPIETTEAYDLTSTPSTTKGCSIKGKVDVPRVKGTLSFGLGNPEEQGNGRNYRKRKIPTFVHQELDKKYTDSKGKSTKGGDDGTLGIHHMHAHGHVDAHKAQDPVHQVMGSARHQFVFDAESFYNFDSSHEIKDFRFGTLFPRMNMTLAGVSKRTTKQPTENSRHTNQQQRASVPMRYAYHLKLIPTIYHRIDGSKKFSFQYSATEDQQEIAFEGGGWLYGRSANELRNEERTVSLSANPGIFFHYELSPMLMTIEERRKPFLEFFTNLLLIFGGVLTMAQMLDSYLFYSFEDKNK